MKKWIIRTAAAFAATVLFVLNAYAAPPTSAHSAILMDADTGRVLYAHNIDRRSLIASTTKIMTALVVLEHCSADTVYTIPKQATNIEGSSIYLKEGEKLTIRELLYGMMLHSGNDAAVALALACSDSVPEFVDLMNLKAQKLGLQDTHFDNPNGLDSETHYSTAADLANLTRYALQNPEFIQIVSTKSIAIGERYLTNHNKLLWSVEGAIGVKTGYTKAAGRILVSAAERDGRRLIAVTIHDGNDWSDHAALYDYGFSCYQPKKIAVSGKIAANIPGLDGGSYPVCFSEDKTFPMLPGEKAKTVVLYPKIAFSACRCGETAGMAAVMLGSKRIATVRLVWAKREAPYGETVTENTFRTRSRVQTPG